MRTPARPADRVSRVPRVFVTVLLSVVVVAAAVSCGEGGNDSAPPASFDVPGIESLPAAAATPGTKLTHGESARVLFVVGDKHKSVISLAMGSVRTGSTSDLANFILNRRAKSSIPYYVDVTVTNVGGGQIGGAPVPLYGVNGHDTMLPAAELRGSFKKCQDDRIPRHLGKGRSFSTCLMFLAPGHGKLISVEFQYASDVAPVTWVVHPRPANPKKEHSH